MKRHPAASIFRNCVLASVALGIHMLCAQSTTEEPVQELGSGDVPKITNVLGLVLTVFESIEAFELSASNNPTSFTLKESQLPSGLNYADGVISGKPTEIGVFPVSIYASNEIGNGPKETLVITVQAAPVLDENLTAGTFSGISNGLMFELTRSSPVSDDLDFFIETSGDLANWTSVALDDSSLEVSYIDKGDGTERVKVAYPDSITNGFPGFIRYRVVRSTASGLPVSDEFSDDFLDTNLWTFVDPVGDSSIAVSDGSLRISVPAESDHDIWTSGNRAPRVFQQIDDTNFSLEVKFGSTPTEQYQFQGLLIEEDATNFIRFDFYSDKSSLHVFGANFVDGAPVALFDKTIEVSSAYYLKTNRKGDHFEMYYSFDGATWIVAGTIDRNLKVTRANVYAGNASGASSPAFTAAVDYVLSKEIAPSGPLVSDDFSSDNLDTSLWTFLDPVGDSSFAVSDGGLIISVPTNSEHDIWRSGSRAPRVTQEIADTDFGFQVKFESTPTEQFQLQGLLIEEDATNFIRFDVYSNGSSLHVFGVDFVDGDPVVLFDQTIEVSSAYYLQAFREEDQFTMNYSLDGTTWIAAGSLDRDLEVTRVSVCAGNASGASSPAFSATVDYVFNTDSPIAPED